MAEVTYHYWLWVYGGMSVSQVMMLKEQDKENKPFLKSVSYLTLDKIILQQRRETSEKIFFKEVVI